MDKKFIILVAILVLVAATGIGIYFYYSIQNSPEIPIDLPDNLSRDIHNKRPDTRPDQGGGITVVDAVPPATDGNQTADNGIMDNIVSEVITNPVENKPDINPVDAANPIRNVKTNPFE